MKEFTATVVREGLGFGEGPRWHEGRLWYSDFYDTASIPWRATDPMRSSNTRSRPSLGLGWLPDGDLVSVSMTDQKVLRFHDDTWPPSLTSANTACSGPMT